jgi:hypothetical protein
VVVDLGQAFDHLLAILADEVDHVGGHGPLLELLAQALVALVPHQGHLVDQVDEALVLVFAPDGHLQGHRMGAQALAQHVETAVEVGSDPVHLVDVDDAGHLVLVGLPPHGLRLGLHAGHRVEDGHRAVEHA